MAHEYVRVQTSDILSDSGREWTTYKYEKRRDGWYVHDGSAWEKFAQKDASKEDVAQLIRKEYDPRY